jgi:hypothetical protein
VDGEWLSLGTLVSYLNEIHHLDITEIYVRMNMDVNEHEGLSKITKSSKGTVPLLLFYISQSHCWIWCWTFIAIFNHAFSELLSPICFSEIKLHSNSISIYKDQNVFTLKSGSSCLVENLFPNAKCRTAMKATIPLLQFACMCNIR